MVTVLTISGMLSVHAKRAVFTALAGVQGVRSAEVELGRAVVHHDDGVHIETLMAAVSVTGCDVIAWSADRRLPIV